MVVVAAAWVPRIVHQALAQAVFRKMAATVVQVLLMPITPRQDRSLAAVAAAARLAIPARAALASA